MIQYKCIVPNINHLIIFYYGYSNRIISKQLLFVLNIVMNHLSFISVFSIIKISLNQQIVIKTKILFSFHCIINIVEKTIIGQIWKERF